MDDPKKAKPQLSTYHQSKGPKRNLWFQVAAVLKFDIEVGAVLEHCYPPADEVMNPREAKDLASLAFPDSNSL